MDITKKQMRRIINIFGITCSVALLVIGIICAVYANNAFKITDTYAFLADSYSTMIFITFLTLSLSVLAVMYLGGKLVTERIDGNSGEKSAVYDRDYAPKEKKSKHSENSFSFTQKYIKCPVCGLVQSAERRSCFGCAIIFDNKDKDYNIINSKQ